MKKPMYFEGAVAILLIMLCFAMYLMLAGNAGPSSQWQVAGSGPVADIHIGDDGTLYTFMGLSGNDIYAIDSGGNVKWDYQAPEQWRVSNRIFIRTSGTLYDYLEPVLASDNGTLYLYVRENKTTSYNFISPSDHTPNESANDSLISGGIMAISPEGKPLWTTTVSDYYWRFCDVNVQVKNERVYAFTGYNLTVLDTHGNQLFKLANISDPPSVDESGYIYASHAGPVYNIYGDLDRDVKDPTNDIDAYYPNGTLYWSITVNASILRPELKDSVRQQYGYLPLYQNGTLYVPASNGVIALYTNGSVKWSKTYANEDCRLYDAMPIDAMDNLYLQYMRTNFTHPDPDIGGVFLRIIAGNGTVIVNKGRLVGDSTADPYDEYAYYLNTTVLINPSLSINLYNPVTAEIAAQDLLNNKSLWKFTIPLGDMKTEIINENNVNTVLEPGLAGFMVSYGRNLANGTALPQENMTVGSVDLTILPGKDIIYLSFSTANYDYPPVLNVSRCVYTSSIYALDKNGTLLWRMPTGSYVTSMAANNSTIFYGMSNGAISAGQAGGIAGGIATVAMLYVFFKFFLAGSVTRARKLLDKNENRNAVYDFILRNPGSTLYDISRTLGMNIGTVRYHLFILGMNHRIVAYHTGVKYVRYFTNSGSYSRAEQSIISLVRRDVMRKILGLLIEKPGLSNMQIAHALNTPESSVSKYMKELSFEGIVMKCPTGSYSIKAEYQPLISNALEHTGMNS